MFKYWIEKFNPSNDHYVPENLRQHFLDVIELLEYDDENWCLIRKSKPTDFWTYIIASYPVAKSLEKMIYGILVIPFGSSDSER